MYKAAKFRAQVAAASSLDSSPPVAPPPPLRAKKVHCPPYGRRALAVALRKAAKFQAQVAMLSPALPPPIAPELAPSAPSVAEAAPPTLPPPAPRTLHPIRARQALSSPRGQRALELALRKAAESLAATTPVLAPVVPLPSLVEVSPPAAAPLSRRRLVPSAAGLKRWTVHRKPLPWVILTVGLAAGAFLSLRGRHDPQDAVVQASPRPSLAWLHQARSRAADGSFRLALDTVNRALVDSPDNPALLKFAGDMHQSLLQFGDAQSAYEQALRANPSNRWVRESLILSRRLDRPTTRRTGRLSALYGLHHAMMVQGRLDEAIAISNQLPSDSALAQRTWQAVLDRTGLRGRVTVDVQGVMTLDLAGNPLPDLTLIDRFPVRRLSLAGTGLEDLRPLAGLPLESLDLSSTPVHDLAPLAGTPLEELRIAHTGVVDLSPLKDCPLRDLDISGTRIAGVEVLSHMPLASLRADGTPLADLRPLAAVPLIRLSLAHTRVNDLRPLQHLALTELILNDTAVADLSPLKGSALRELALANTPVTDLTPLAGTPLNVLTLAGCRNVKDLRPLLTCTELEHLHLPPNARPLAALHTLPHLRFIEGESGTPER